MRTQKGKFASALESIYNFASLTNSAPLELLPFFVRNHYHNVTWGNTISRQKWYLRKHDPSRESFLLWKWRQHEEVTWPKHRRQQIFRCQNIVRKSISKWARTFPRRCCCCVIDRWPKSFELIILSPVSVEYSSSGSLWSCVSASVRFNQSSQTFAHASMPSPH